ncbi:MAG: thioredoxin family protein [Muribaculaceae bacterium]|nr:thioredoxin family protein [Muribaculaceae bacterium]
MQTKRLLNILIAIMLCAFATNAQQLTPVKWTKSIKMTDEKNGVITFTANIDNGWHMYSNDSPEGDGPIPLSIIWDKKDGIKLVGGLQPSKSPTTIDDEMFGMKVRQWDGNVTLTQKFTTTANKYNIEGEIRYQACSTGCVYESERFDFSGTVDKKEEAKENTKEEDADKKSDEEVVEEEIVEETADDEGVATDSLTTTSNKASLSLNSKSDLWAPVKFTDKAAEGTEGNSNSLWYLFWTCFLGGFIALLTPCVWPIIPLTVSFFLKKGTSKSKSITSAVTYGLSIIVIYVLLGLLVTAIFGANGLNALATNAVCNIIFFLLLVLFAISFLGAFEIKLPDSWSSKMDSRAEKTTGLLSIFFMAFTLVIVSFSCTGPIIGTLLVQTASSGSYMGPVVGMFGFALALAIPFTLFALFPSMLKKLPKSGSWLNTVKVVLGFLELALSLKFLSVADLAYGWHILDRETFLALWIAIFGLLGLYLLGMLHLKSDGEKRQPIGVVRLMLGIITLAFTAYLIPGLWGAPLRTTSAFVPPMYTQDYNTNPETNKEWEDFEAGVAAAEKSGKPVFLEFSGYGCVNCRKMESAVMGVDKVKNELSENFTHIRLMVDDKTELDNPITIKKDGKVVKKLRTVGDKWSYLQEVKFNANSQPYYVVLNSKGELMSGPFVYKEDIDGFLDFLKRGKEKYEKQK